MSSIPMVTKFHLNTFIPLRKRVCLCVCPHMWYEQKLHILAEFLLYCMSFVRVLSVFFTIKNLQHVKLSLGVETFKGNGDVVSFLYCDAP